MSDFTFWDIVRNLLTGLQWTLALSLVAFIGGGVIGLLIMVMRISKKTLPRSFARTYIELFQGTPLLMQLFLVFFGVAVASTRSPTASGKPRRAWRLTRWSSCAT
jgi:polar amino acid transport system permease protein